LLQNRVYRGEVVHKGQVYPGEHAAILDQELWDGVQQRLAQNRRERGAGQRGRNPALLLGILYDASGDRLTPTHAVRRGVRYRYYVSHRLVVSGRKGAPDGRRIPASDLERLVTDTLLQYLADPVRLLALLGEAGAALSSISKQHQLIRAAKELAQAWPTLDPARQREFLHRLIGRVDVSDEAVTLQLDPGQLLNALNARGQAAATLTALPDDSGDGASTGHDRAPHTPASPPLILSVPSTLKRAGREMTLLLGDQDAPARQNPALIQLVVRAHAMRDALMASGDASLNEVAEREGMTKSYIARLVRLAYLAPGITQSILHSTQPSTITPSHLMRDTRLPIAWSEQERLLGAI
jgi:hypothetical protein